MKHLTESEVAARFDRMGAKIEARGFDEPLHLCRLCQDIGLLLRTNERGEMFGLPCPECDLGRQLETGEKLERTKRRLRTIESNREVERERQEIIRQAARLDETNPSEPLEHELPF